MADDPCPVCESPKTITGAMYGSEYPAGTFLPDHSRRIPSSPGLNVSQARFRACLTCGHLWAAIDPHAVRAHVGRHGGELVKQTLAEMDHGPCRDLPDTAWGRMVGANVSELDAIARAGGPGLIGRYREMRGVTWDEAIRETKGWPRKTREEKLVLFGWVAKEKPVKDDLAELV
jgi:hypothetical protein